MYDKLVWSQDSPGVIYKSVGCTLDLTNQNIHKRRLEISIFIKCPR